MPAARDFHPLSVSTLNVWMPRVSAMSICSVSALLPRRAKAKIAQSWALMVHCCTRLVWAVPEAQSNRGVRGTTRGCPPATPRVR